MVLFFSSSPLAKRLASHRSAALLAGAVAGEGLDVGVVAINKIAGRQVLAGVCLHVSVLSIQSGGTRSRAGTTEANADFKKFRLGRRRDAGKGVHRIIRDALRARVQQMEDEEDSKQRESGRVAEEHAMLLQAKEEVRDVGRTQGT